MLSSSAKFNWASRSSSGEVLRPLLAIAGDSRKLESGVLRLGKAVDGGADMIIVSSLKRSDGEIVPSFTLELRAAKRSDWKWVSKSKNSWEVNSPPTRYMESKAVDIAS